MVSTAAKQIMRVNPASAVFFECDIQAKLGPMVHKYSTVTHNAKRLTQVSKALSIPVISTRQVPKVFLDVNDEVKAEHHDGVKQFDKSLFSMLEPPVKEHFLSL